jgi:hypothetical protein
MIQSPFKQKPLGTSKQAQQAAQGSIGVISNQYLRNIGSVSKKSSLSLQKTLASSLRQSKGEEMKSAQRSILNPNYMAPEEQARSFNSKSPSKKSAQL